MSNASLKEQLQAVASQLSDTVVKDTSGKKNVSKPKLRPPEKSSNGKKPKPKWLEYAHYGVELLRAYFPACFKAVNDVTPLKKGIKQDLILRLSTLEKIVTEDKACMVKSLAYYVNTASYHKTVVEGAVRIDLDGNPAGVVTKEEAKYSVDRHQAKLQAKQTSSQDVKSPKEIKNKVEATHV